MTQTPPPPPNDDTSYRFLFSHPELVRDLIKGFIPDPWLHSLDYTTLEKVPGHYVSDDLQNRADDVVWRVKAGGSWVYLYILIEFQSTIDRYMALRMMVYTGLLYQDLIKRKEVLAGGLLPPVLPIVLYNGDSRWTAATNIAELIPAVPGIVAQFKPNMQYLLIDEGSYEEHELASLKNLVAAVFRLEQPSSPQAIIELIDNLRLWLDDRPDLQRMFAVWMRATISKKSNYTYLLPNVDNLKELNMTLSTRMTEWAEDYKVQGRQEGRQEGIEKGQQRGEAQALQRLLRKRFVTLSPELEQRIDNATVTQIEVWFDIAIDATSLNQVFDEPTQH